MRVSPSRLLCLVPLFFHLSAFATTEEMWSWRTPAAPRPQFHGTANFDGAGSKTGPILYPAPGLAGLVAAVATHALLIESEKSSQKKQLISEADNVLVPYAGVIESISHSELMAKALSMSVEGKRGRITEVSEPVVDGAVLESVQIFSMTQDQSALVLEHTMSLKRAGGDDAVLHQEVVRVVSSSHSSDNFPQYWTADNGKKLKAISTALLGESIDIFFDAYRNKGTVNANPQKTFRFKYGNEERFERGQLVAEKCSRDVLLTLYGTLLSVPKRADRHEPDVCK